MAKSTLVAVVVALMAGHAAAVPAGTEGATFFEKKVRPVLAAGCYKCHSAEAAQANKLRGGLRLDTKAGWQKGGDTGAAIGPGRESATTAADYIGGIARGGDGLVSVGSSAFRESALGEATASVAREVRVCVTTADRAG